ncbi:MAG TPA: type II toxin-antitoxin system VapC family toxin [Anaerolineales bacterium]|nr:type II toxin-antitoxin system VapC family toxin [Anaerolineales bacterium]
MILYADTSALVKKYIQEAGSDQVIAFFDTFEVIGTLALTQAEMAAAMSKAGRQGWVEQSAITKAWEVFLSHWPNYMRLPVSAAVVDRAAELAWQHRLRAYDSLHLASTLTWQESAGEAAIIACFDKQLIDAALKEGLQVWPGRVG